MTIYLLLKNTNYTNTTKPHLANRLFDAIKLLLARILNAFQKAIANCKVQANETPSLLDRTYTFVSDHKLAIGVGVTIGVIALGMFAYNATPPSQIPLIQEEVTSLPLPSSELPLQEELTSSPLPTSSPPTSSSENFPFSNWLQEETTRQSGNLNSPITLFTSYTRDNPERLNLSRLVATNHQTYCEQQQYHHLVFERNLAVGALPYCSKIAGLKEMLEAPENVRKKWFAWLDDDMVITNRELKMESFIDRLSENDHIIVTEDAVSQMNPNIPLNTGFILVRNSDKSRHILNEIWNKRFETIKNSITYANCPAQSCLHEQQALTDLLEEQPNFQQFVRIIPQRFWGNIGINTFSRQSHYDMSRQMILNYLEDPVYSKWKVGDFMAQCTGMATNGNLYVPEKGAYESVTSNLRENCIQKLLEAPPFGNVDWISSLLSSFFRDI